MDTKDISLTIYNGGFGAVKEIRTINIDGNDTELVYADVAQKIETSSLIVEGLNILEFNYDFDLVDRDKLLRKYIDKEVFLKDRKTSERKSCRLLSAEGAGKCVLEDNESKEIYLDTQSEIVLPSLPLGLIVKPALVWKIAQTNTDKVKVSYLSEGFSWNANYVVELKNQTLNITGWAEIQNQCGMTFENARIKLIAGDINRTQKDDNYYEVEVRYCKSSIAPQAEEKAFFDYHMYTLNHLTTLKDNQTKQINILGGSEIPYKQYYNLNLYEEKAEIMIEFQNSKDSGLGIAIPKGNIKLYKADDADNSLEFIGEDSINHTPKDEAIKLSIGNAFDITFDNTEIDRKMIGGFEHFKYECKIKNHKDIEAEIHYAPYDRGIVELVSSSHQYEKKSSNQLEYTVIVPADSEEKIEYEYRIDRRTEVVIKKS